jgi:hypothetical protein
MAKNYVAAFTEIVGKVETRRERSGVTSDYPVMSSCRSKYPFWLRKLKRYLAGSRAVARASGERTGR